MSDEGKKITEAQLAAYLEGTLDAEETKAFKKMIAQDPDAQAAIELQRHMDESLRRQMAFEAPTDVQLQLLIAGSAPMPPSDASLERPIDGKWLTRRKALLLAVAACVAWGLVAWQWSSRDRLEVVFEPRSLVEIYQESVERGFEPYYECREPERFASTFLTRQGKSLHLLEMPEDRYMLGLSYSGGLSRNTTAMLCRVDDQPVMVFVDRLEDDHPPSAESSDPALTVFRDERDDLVIYEVTPVPSKTVAGYLSTTQSTDATKSD